MQTLEVSDAVYNDVISRRVGGEAISKTPQRELKPAPECAISDELDEEARAALKEKRGSLSDLKKKYHIE